MAMTSTYLTRPQAIDPATVTGWGVDADPRNDPTYPYRLRGDDSGPAKAWDRPTQQRPDVEVLRSIEHNRLPAVVGTSTPPSGLSGMMRRVAFRYSESDWTHWLLLLGADRINAVEGMIEDLSHGRVPDIPGEMGIQAAWQHNRRALVTKTAITVGVAALVVAALRARNIRRVTRKRAQYGMHSSVIHEGTVLRKTGGKES
jgi:hypothetical protein